MKKILKGVALLLVIMSMTACVAAEEPITVTAEEYELLQKYKRLEEITSVIEKNYLWDYNADSFVEGAALGLLGSLGDNYSYYYTASDIKGDEEALTGEYAGLGLEVFPNPNDMTITIRRVFYGGPAQEAGLREGDKIVAIEGEEMTAYDLNRAVEIMRGEVGEPVTMSIFREGESKPFDVVATRAIVQTEIITHDLIGEGIGYIRVHQFEGNVMEQLKSAEKALTDQGIKGLLLDLRGNPGGFIDRAVQIADEFLGDHLVAITEDRYGRTVEYHTEDGMWDIPMMILVDETSASASELLAAALRDNGRAKIVGVKTYGKGIVQTVFPLRFSNGGMQLTTNYWFTPKGDPVHEIGIAPDYLVELDEDALDQNFNIQRDKDNQLQKAKETLLEQINGG